MTLERLYDRSAALAYARQKRFAAQVGNRIWWVDPQNGIARLYTPQREPSSGNIAIQILGSQAVHGGYWKWEWSNPLNGTAPSACKVAEAIRKLGDSAAIAELVTPEVKIDSLVQPETMAAIAVARFDVPGYFVHAVGGGALRIPILVDETFRTPDDRDLLAFANTISEVAASGLPVSNIRDLIEGYLEALRIDFEALADGNLVAQTATQQLRVDIRGDAFSFKVSAR